MSGYVRAHTRLWGDRYGRISLYSPIFAGLTSTYKGSRSSKDVAAWDPMEDIQNGILVMMITPDRTQMDMPPGMDPERILVESVT